SELLLSRLAVPHLHSLVSAGTDDAFAIRAERHTGHSACVSFESGLLLSRLAVPQLHSLAMSGTVDAVTVLPGRHPRDNVPMATKCWMFVLAQGIQMPPFPATQLRIAAEQDFLRSHQVEVAPAFTRLAQLPHVNRRLMLPQRFARLLLLKFQ